MRSTSTDEASLVVAAQAGDPRALDDLVAAYLPLVYTVVRRALSGHPDVDDVVQETMLRALRELRVLRAPESFRPWLVAIAVRQVGTYLHRRRLTTERTAPLDELTESDAGFEELTLLRVELSDQRRQVVRASRWLDPDDRVLLSLWWLETAGELNRTELAAALGTGVAHAGVRIQRMRKQLELSRSLVAALEARPSCARLESVLTDWDGAPGPLWRKRIARHTRTCAVCARAAEKMIEPERLLLGVALLPVPAALAAAVIGEERLTGAAAGTASVAAAGLGTAGGAGGAGLAGGAGAAGAKAGLLGQLAQAVGAHPVAAAITVGVLVAGAAVTATAWPAAPPREPTAVGAPTAGPGAATPTPRPTDPTAAPRPSAGGRSLAPGPVSLGTVNGAGLVVATGAGLGTVERIGAASDGPSRQRATFEVVPGLADPNCVSLRAADGRYLRHLSWRLVLSRDEGTALFRGDATFCVRAGSVPGAVTLESANYPGWFLRHRDDELWVDRSDGSTAFRADASFWPRPPLAR